MSEYNLMQSVKRDMFAMRNGAVADHIRRLGNPYRIIFGLNLPQISEIAARYAGDTDLAERLWANVSTRESMLMAPMIYPPEKMTEETAMRWIEGIPSAETADVLCLKLLKKLSFAPGLVDRLAGSDRDMDRYVALRLAFNLLPDGMERALRLAQAEQAKGIALTVSISGALIDKIEFLTEV
ncbi:MAG: DNA alkylation repair protein [Pseudoflavonifractor sp.]|nr:DNA alkylation repair protein [Pseudoflavonifractor sp.]